MLNAEPERYWQWRRSICRSGPCRSAPPQTCATAHFIITSSHHHIISSSHHLITITLLYISSAPPQTCATAHFIITFVYHYEWYQTYYIIIFLPQHVPLRISSLHLCIIMNDIITSVYSYIKRITLSYDYIQHVPLRISSLHLYIIMNDIKLSLYSYFKLIIWLYPTCATAHLRFRIDRYIIIFVYQTYYIIICLNQTYHIIVSNLLHQCILISNLLYDCIQHAPLRICGLGLIVISLYSYIKLIISLYA